MARCASIGSPVTSPIAEMPRIKGAALVADPDEGAVDVKIEGLEAKTRGGGLAADRDKDLVGIECSLLAIRRFDLERPAFLLTF